MIIVLYLVILLAGVFISSRNLMKTQTSKLVDPLLTGSLLSLIFLMGIKVGMDENVLSSFRTIGWQALVLVTFSVGFSILGVRLVAANVLRGKGDAR